MKTKPKTTGKRPTVHEVLKKLVAAVDRAHVAIEEAKQARNELIRLAQKYQAAAEEKDNE